MTHVCPFCHNQTMVKIEQNGGEKYFLCKVDTVTAPPKIDISTGLAVLSVVLSFSITKASFKNNFT